MDERILLLASLVWAGALFATPMPGRSVEAFPRESGETDDTERIRRAVKASTSGVVCFPAGVYYVSEPIEVLNQCSLQLHKNAIVRAVKPMPFVFKVNNWKRRPTDPDDQADFNLFITGGRIDGNGLAGCLALDGFQHYTLRDVTFLNGKRYGLRVNGEDGGCELIAQNLYFVCKKSGLAGNTAIYTTGGDSHYTDCVIVDYTIGIRNAGGSNRYTRCHVWGGPVPPVQKGELPEMLKDSVNFWNEDGDALFRDCYADTGKTGFRIEASAQLLGCRYFNNRVFRLDDVTVIDHRRGALLVSDGNFMDGGTPTIWIYRSTKAAKGKVAWRDCQCSPGFKDALELPGFLDFEADQEVLTADDWEYCPDAPLSVSVSPEVLKAQGCQNAYLSASPRRMNRRFPNAGAGQKLIVRARATDALTREVEMTLRHVDGKVWGTQIPLTAEWRDIVVPFEKLRYFSHWKTLPPLEPGDHPDARKLASIVFCFGTWLCLDSQDSAHGFEVSSVRIVGR